MMETTSEAVFRLSKLLRRPLKLLFTLTVEVLRVAALLRC